MQRQRKKQRNKKLRARQKVIRKILAVMLIMGVVGLIVGGVMLKRGEGVDEAGLRILATSFPAYDFARAVVGDDGKVEMLLAPGAEIHDYEPTPQDIIKIQESDVFIYTGGESETWVDEMLEGIDSGRIKVIRMMDLVELMVEDEEGGEVEYDEHVWTSLRYAIVIVGVLRDELIELDKNKAEDYTNNAKSYIEELQEIDGEIRNLVKRGKRKEIVFGDRFALRYFVEEYGLDYDVAFPGCSEQTEVSVKTLTSLVDKVRELGAPVVLKNEMSNNGIAETIAGEAGVEVLEFYSGHSMAPEDFRDGVTYVEMMRRNVRVLERALY